MTQMKRGTQPNILSSFILPSHSSKEKFMDHQPLGQALAHFALGNMFQMSQDKIQLDQDWQKTQSHSLDFLSCGRQ